MNGTTEHYWTDDPEQVERYILGRVSDEERKRMEAEIAHCEPCKEKLRAEMELAAGIKRSGRDMARSRLRMQLKKERSPLQRYSYAGLAAAILVIAAGIGVYRMFFSDLTAPQRFQTKEIVIGPSATDTGGIAGRTTDETATEPSAEQQGTDSDVAAMEQQTPSREEAVSGSGARREQAMERPARRAASSERRRSVPRTVRPFSHSVWLIGTVTMVSEKNAAPSAAGQAKMSDRSENFALQKKAPAHTTMPFSTADSSAGRIVVERRSFGSLPASRRTRLAATNHIETLVEFTEKGLDIVLFNDAITDDALASARVEVLTNDSLIVTLPGTQIVYRLPDSWNVRERILKR